MNDSPLEDTDTLFVRSHQLLHELL